MQVMTKRGVTVSGVDYRSRLSRPNLSLLWRRKGLDGKGSPRLITRAAVIAIDEFDERSNYRLALEVS